VEYETPKPLFTIGEISDENDDDDDDGDDDFVKGEKRAFGRENVGPIASPYILPYLYNRRRRHLDTRYGFRKDGDSLKIGDSTVLVDTDSDITIRGKEFRGTTGLWELLTRKSVDRRKITTDDVKNYKKILELTNAHLTDHRPGADIEITRRSKYRDFIAPPFPHVRRRGIETALRRRWAKYCWPPPPPLADCTMIPPDRRRFGPCENCVAVKKNNIKLNDIRDWLEEQDGYKIHRPIIKRFARNPYTVNDVMDVWECDLVHVRDLGKYNDKSKYILSVIDVFSKFLHLVPLRSKTGTAVASAFISIFEDSSRRRRSGCEQTRANNS